MIKSKKKINILMIFFFSIFFYGSSQKSIKKFIYNQKGDCPIILSAAHAGRPENLISGVGLRTGKNVKQFNTKWDTNTDKITLRVKEILEKKYKLRPYVVFAKFSRKQIDANREPEFAYEDAKAKPYYDQYYQYVREAVFEVLKKYKTGLLIDIHGQSKKPSFIWRGTRGGKTVKKLIKKYGWDALLGNKGLFGSLKKLGYPIYPETKEGKERPYQGGYTVNTFGSYKKNGINAIQLEIGKDFRLNREKMEDFCKDLSYSIFVFYSAYIK